MCKSAELIARHVAHKITTLLWVGYLETLMCEFRPLNVSCSHEQKESWEMVMKTSQLF